MSGFFFMLGWGGGWGGCTIQRTEGQLKSGGGSEVGSGMLLCVGGVVTFDLFFWFSFPFSLSFFWCSSKVSDPPLHFPVSPAPAPRIRIYIGQKEVLEGNGSMRLCFEILGAWVQGKILQAVVLIIEGVLWAKTIEDTVRRRSGIVDSKLYSLFIGTLWTCFDCLCVSLVVRPACLLPRKVGLNLRKELASQECGYLGDGGELIKKDEPPFAPLCKPKVKGAH